MAVPEGASFFPDSCISTISTASKCGAASHANRIIAVAPDRGAVSRRNSALNAVRRNEMQEVHAGAERIAFRGPPVELSEAQFLICLPVDQTEVTRQDSVCLLDTFYAADDLLCVDLGGRCLYKKTATIAGCVFNKLR